MAAEMKLCVQAHFRRRGLVFTIWRPFAGAKLDDEQDPFGLRTGEMAVPPLLDRGILAPAADERLLAELPSESAEAGANDGVRNFALRLHTDLPA